MARLIFGGESGTLMIGRFIGCRLRLAFEPNLEGDSQLPRWGEKKKTDFKHPRVLGVAAEIDIPRGSSF